MTANHFAERGVSCPLIKHSGDLRSLKRLKLAALDRLTPRSNAGSPKSGTERPFTGVQRQQRTWHLCRRGVGRAAVRFGGQVRFRYWL